jgi:hypothetical protein
MLRRTHRSLNRAWIGFKTAKKEGDHDKMKYYPEGIQKFERQLREEAWYRSPRIYRGDLE